MGSDSSPHLLFVGIYEALQQLGSEIFFHVFVAEVDKALILKSFQKVSKNIIFEVVSDSILMEENPLLAFKNHPDSSMILGLRKLKKKQFDAFITLGNTGALVVSSRLILGCLSCIRRPGLLATLPTKNKKMSIIDVGANATCNFGHLLNFALLGAHFQKIVYKIDNPKVGLLNIGSESRKGTVDYQKTFFLMEKQKSPFYQFVGNIESNDLFNGSVDVVICDGFTGNVLLKTAEGLVSYFYNSLLGYLEGSVEKEKIASFIDLLASDRHSGALLSGVDGLVIKCHGNSSAKAVKGAIFKAVSLINRDYLEKIRHFLSQASS